MIRILAILVALVWSAAIFSQEATEAASEQEAASEAAPEAAPAKSEPVPAPQEVLVIESHTTIKAPRVLIVDSSVTCYMQADELRCAARPPSLPIGK